MRFRARLEAAVLACMVLGRRRIGGRSTEGSICSRTVRSKCRRDSRSRRYLCQPRAQLLRKSVEWTTGTKVPGVNGVYSFWLDENILYYVPKHKFLGGYFMPYVALNYANGELVANITGTNLSTGGGGSGFSDMYVQPLNLGWHIGKQVDFNAGYAFVAPTGRFTQGASDNVGSGYWGNLVTTGTTLYITKNKGTTANLMTAWEIHGRKMGTDITPGQAFTTEWGFGEVLPLKKDMSRLLQVGLVGYDQSKCRIAVEP